MSKNKQKENKDHTFRLRMSREEFEVMTHVSNELGKTKSQIVREALDMYYDYWFNR